MSAAVTECAVDKCIYYLLNLRIAIVDCSWWVWFVSLQLVNLLNSCTEDILVILSCFLCDLNVSAVVCTKCNCTVKHKLHVTCTWCFCTCCGNLLGNICCRYDLLCIRYVVILNKYNLDLIVYIRIVVYKLSNLVDVLNYSLCSCVSRSCLCTKDECCRLPVRKFAVFKLEVNIHNGECVE